MWEIVATTGDGAKRLPTPVSAPQRYPNIWHRSPLRLRNNLRRKPLHVVLKACGSNRQALQEAVANLKDRALAKFVERAYRITQSTNPLIVGHKIAELLIDTVVGRANRYALRQGNIDGCCHAALDHAASASLDACKPEIVRLLSKSAWIFFKRMPLLSL